MKPEIETLGPDEFDYDEDAEQASTGASEKDADVSGTEDTAEFHFPVSAQMKAAGL